MKVKYISQAWLVLILALGFGAALAGVDVWLGPRIAANKRAATLEQIPVLVDGASQQASARIDPLKIEAGEGADQRTYEVYWALSDRGELLGWVVKASGQGFADKIELLIGLDARAEKITGVSVLDQKETPGLGNKIEAVGDKDDKGFLWQFFHHGIPTDRQIVVTTASPDLSELNKIKAVSGATISSEAVAKIINRALNETVRTTLRQAAAETPEIPL